MRLTSTGGVSAVDRVVRATGANFHWWVAELFRSGLGRMLLARDFFPLTEVGVRLKGWAETPGSEQGVMNVKH